MPTKTVHNWTLCKNIATNTKPPHSQLNSTLTTQPYSSRSPQLSLTLQKVQVHRCATLKKLAGRTMHLMSTRSRLYSSAQSKTAHSTFLSGHNPYFGWRHKGDTWSHVGLLFVFPLNVEGSGRVRERDTEHTLNRTGVCSPPDRARYSCKSKIASISTGVDGAKAIYCRSSCKPKKIYPTNLFCWYPACLLCLLGGCIFATAARGGFMICG